MSARTGPFASVPTKQSSCGEAAGIPSDSTPSPVYDSGSAGFPTSMMSSSGRPGKSAASGRQYSHLRIRPGCRIHQQLKASGLALNHSCLSQQLLWQLSMTPAKQGRTDTLVHRLVLAASPVVIGRPGKECGPPVDSGSRVLWWQAQHDGGAYG